MFAVPLVRVDFVGTTDLGKISALAAQMTVTSPALLGSASGITDQIAASRLSE
jgi:hypothetical protein